MSRVSVHQLMVVGSWIGLNISQCFPWFLLSSTSSSSCSLSIAHIGTFLQHSWDFNTAFLFLATERPFVYFCTHYPLMSQIIPKTRWHGSWASKEYFPDEINERETYRWRAQRSVCTSYEIHNHFSVQMLWFVFASVDVHLVSRQHAIQLKWNTTAIRKLYMM